MLEGVNPRTVSTAAVPRWTYALSQSTSGTSEVSAGQQTLLRRL